MMKQIVLVVCLCCLPYAATGQTIHNFDVATGDWEVATNWDTDAAQVDGDSAFVNNDGEASLAVDTAVLLDLGVGQGTDPGTAAQLMGTLNHSAGTLSSADGWIRIGGDGGLGTYNMSGTAALSASHMFGEQRVYVGHGGGGDGTMTMADMASLTTDGQLIIGNTGAIGSLEMNGDSTIDADTISVGEGGADDMGNPLDPGIGSLVMNDNSMLTGLGVNVGRFETGQGELTMNDSSRILVNGWLNIGDNTSTPGGVKLATININDNATIDTDNINMGNAATVVVNQTGGTVTSNNWIGISNFGGGDVTYNLSGGSLISLADVVTVGEDGIGTMTVSGSATLDAQGTALIVGRNDGSTGTLNIDGSLATISAADFQLDIGATSAATVNWIADANGVSPVSSADNTEFGDSVTMSVDLTNLANWADTGTGDTTVDLLLIDNAAAATGTFDGLLEGDIVPGTNGATITYVGGTDSFDVVLSGVPINNAGPVDVAPATITTTRGQYVTGGIPEISADDTNDYSIRRSTADIQSRTEFVVTATSPTETPTSFAVTLNGSVFARSAVNQTIELFNYDTSAWEELDTRAAARFGDSNVEVSAAGDLARFVEDGTGAIQARVRFRSVNPRQLFTSNTDQFIWTIE